jgi:hypothetical protein
LLDSIIKKETLNTKQQIAFCIIANALFKLLDDQKNGINKVTEPNFKPYLKLLLSGPGGTGKTHVVRAIQQVMKIYGCEHKIRFLAPSGSAASLIDGMTVHKGLSIKVKKSGKNNGKCSSDNTNEDYTILINISDRKKVREEFKDVILVMCDKASLLSTQLLAEMDHAMRYALNNNKYLGGIIVIFAGDFYQFPPVFGSSLYTPIKNSAKATDQKLLKRLGCLCWKSVTEVIILEEQERMKNDPDYTQAVLNLRTHTCTISDVDLFNSHVVMSVEHPHGINMSANENENATAIVATNLLRQTINM